MFFSVEGKTYLLDEVWVFMMMAQSEDFPFTINQLNPETTTGSMHDFMMDH